ncbi:MAG: stage 0 sporulation protein [Anaerolineae bacterium]|nr:stage 0 sporulation protein [Anaerolineae bacterium]
MDDVAKQSGSEHTSEEAQTLASSIVAVNFQEAGKPYHFLAAAELDLEPGAWVIVETTNGMQAGRVVGIDIEVADRNTRDLKPVLRRATGVDMARYQVLQKRADRVLDVAREELAALNISEVKLVSAEIPLDQDQATVLYTGNLSGKDNSALRRRLSSRMRSRIDLRSVGPRDHAKILGGYGVCGEPRCCARFLGEFDAVSIRMAKDQSISMAPSDITGMCGRLRCCLSYEHQVYLDAGKGFPKRKSHVQTAEGVGRVLDWDVLKNEVIVEVPPDGPRRDRKRFRFGIDEVEVISRGKG